ncbi:family 2 glycosyl transferase [Novosphingobium sp. Rr 2-17]|uniref:glycosyltransferase n=1 Tax=Novosphingobium sp. Rr 2-17 TaxID=555793 RepID=UPI0002698B4F|nr:glycosyltransferase [Novosphingobium sp. Rr 2-17]EIZ80907.1 family 2 glycosyl transferase [Novosphingobium sp. Rr 2-17]
MPSPAISVAMSVYNGERFLAPAIESVLAQDFADFEFLILDDGSTDATAAIVSRYAQEDRRIRPIVRENRGLVSSLNELIDAAHAPIVARMDADDICRADRFGKQLGFLSANPDYGVVGSWTADIDAYDKPYHITGKDHPSTHEAFLEAVEKGWPLLCHPAVMFRRDVVQAVGGYHGAFRHCEDYDLWLRLASVTRLASIPERLLQYRHYSDQVSSRHATEQQIGAAVSYLAYQERRAGRADPTSTLERLPPVDELDTLFGREGISREVRARVAPGLLYSRAGLRDEGFDLLLQYLQEGGSRKGMWRVVARLVRFGEPTRAARLAATLAIGL